MKSLERVFCSCCAVGNDHQRGYPSHHDSVQGQAKYDCLAVPMASLPSEQTEHKPEQPNADGHTHWHHLTGAKAFRDTFRRDSEFPSFSHLTIVRVIIPPRFAWHIVATSLQLLPTPMKYMYLKLGPPYAHHNDTACAKYRCIWEVPSPILSMRIVLLVAISEDHCIIIHSSSIGLFNSCIDLHTFRTRFRSCSSMSPPMLSITLSLTSSFGHVPLLDSMVTAGSV